MQLHFFAAPDFGGQVIDGEPIRIMVHSARMRTVDGTSSILDVKMHYCQEYKFDAADVLAPGSIITGVPFIDSIWHRLAVQVDVPAGKNTIIYGFDMSTAQIEYLRLFPAFKITADHVDLDAPPPRSTSLYSDVAGVVKRGLAWQRFVDILPPPPEPAAPNSEMDSVGRCDPDTLEEKVNSGCYVGNTYIRIFAEPD